MSLFTLFLSFSITTIYHMRVTGYFLLLVLGICSAHSSSTQKEVITAYLDLAVDMITKAKDNMPSCDPKKRRLRVPKDYFYKDWESYKEGFGRIEKDFWLGNDNIFALTNQKLYSVRFDLMDVEKNTSYALYDNFWIDEEYYNYTLHISNYSGDAGDAMTDHDNMLFSTKDRDNDIFSRNCAVDKKGAWWYKKCASANLNGLYHKGEHAGRWDGIYWQPWRGLIESLEWTEIKIRPKLFSASSSPVTT